ncbi:nucleotidyltransferase family protein [Vulcanococcus limneticus]|uniref:nucleotidyltransferase family protein n=1 Tax=Vulcanococcus limneticus TaxID=2170428 RepID=UPI00398C07D1
MPPSLPKGGHEVPTPHTEQIRSGLVSAAPPTSIRERLEALRSDVLDLAHRHGASNLRVYGSIATGLEHERSDIDLLVDLSPENSLLGVISLRQDLEDLLGCSVDVTEETSLHPLIRDEILGQAVVL